MMRSCPTRSRAIGALTALLFIGAHAASLVHYAGVDHVVCEAHGDVAHGDGHVALGDGHGHGHDDATDAAELAHADVPAGPAWRAPESTPDHAHEHCDLEEVQRPELLALACCQGELDLPPPAAPPLSVESSLAGFGAPTPLLLLAPKTSPPGVGLAAV